MTRWKRRVTVTAAAVGVGLLSVASPAAAHDTSVGVYSYDHPTGSVKVHRGQGAVFDQHRVLHICDVRGDGIGVWAEYFYWDPNVGGGSYRYGTVSDTDGKGGTCGVAGMKNGQYFTEWQGHSRDGGATGWITA